MIQNLSKPFVSLIMPVYRTSLDAVKRACDSVCSQTYGNYELIIVDDGSGEEYTKELSGIEDMDARFRLVFASHGGASAARNCGIEQAHGDCIMFLDSDDELVEDCIEHAVNYLVSKNLDIVCGAVEYVYAAHSEERSPFSIPDLEFYVLEEEKVTPLRNYFFANEMVSALPEITGLQRGPVAKLFTKQVIGNIRFNPSFTMYEDSVFLSFVFGRAHRVGLVDECWYVYHQNASSIVHSFTLDDSFDGHVRALSEVSARNDVDANAYWTHISHYFFEALEEGMMAENGVKLSTVKENLQKPFCRDAFLEVDNSEFRYTPKRRIMHWLAKRNAALPIYGLYKLRKAFWGKKGHTVVDA